jgi:hypothetical protein
MRHPLGQSVHVNGTLFSGELGHHCFQIPVKVESQEKMVGAVRFELTTF